MISFISKKPLLIAAILFYLSGLIWIINAFVKPDAKNIAIGAMFFAVGSLYITMHAKRHNSDSKKPSKS